MAKLRPVLIDTATGAVKLPEDFDAKAWAPDITVPDYVSVLRGAANQGGSDYGAFYIGASDTAGDAYRAFAILRSEGLWFDPDASDQYLAFWDDPTGDTRTKDLTIEGQNFSVDAASLANSHGGNVIINAGAGTAPGDQGHCILTAKQTTADADRSVLELFSNGLALFAGLENGHGSRAGSGGPWNFTPAFLNHDVGFGIENAADDPVNTPTGGYFIYAKAGALKGKGTSATVTTIGNADPHCPTCGSDFATEFQNDAWGDHIAVCWPCFFDEIDAPTGPGGKVDRRKFMIVDKRAKLTPKEREDRSAAAREESMKRLAERQAEKEREFAETPRVPVARVGGSRGRRGTP